MVKSGQAVTVLFSTSNATTGALADADATPVGTLYVDGTANAATVTETNVSTGIYKAAVTLPALTAGQIVSLGIAATVAGVAGGGIVWQDVADTSRVSDVKSDTAAILVDTGTDGVQLAAYQNAIEFIWPKLTISTSGEGIPALTISNDAILGIGLQIEGMYGARVVMPGAVQQSSIHADIQGQLTGAVGSVTSGVTLADDAIKASKFDESTAYPLKSADTGATAVARTGADGDTLETLSDQMDSVKAKTDIITANSITVVSPVNSDGDVSIDRGYDYYATDGRQLTWTDSADITWPDLTDATATFYVGDFLDVACTITSPTGPATITLELSKANTELLPVGVRPFHIDVELSNTHLILQIRGKITVRD